MDTAKELHNHDLRLQRLEDSQQVLNDKFMQHMEWEQGYMTEEKVAREKQDIKIDKLDEKLDALTLSNFSTAEGQRSFKTQVVVAVTIVVGIISVVQSAAMIYINLGKL